MAGIIALNVVLVALAVIIHYEFLFHVSSVLPKMRVRPRYRIVLGVFGALVAHAVEIWLFAFAYYVMHEQGDWGRLQGNFSGSLLDCSYFSFTVYTTVGFGDIEPVGNLRYLTGIESLTGLVLITWTASFLYYEMQRSWDVR
ncbi:MAG: two pore domain potassium channel family protein [Gammaproteobacteria bacterium]|nr:two pore domain potassium channel family protein [Gammaproteobacteria bacterium]